MKYWIYFYSCVILGSCSSNSTSDKIYDESLYVKVDSIDVTKTGYEILISTVDTNRKLIKYFWPNGKTQLIAYYYNGYKDGTWRVFMDDGELISVTRYLNNKKEGKVLSYHPNGKVATIEEYHQGNAVGTWYYYDSLGILIKTENYK